MGCLINGKRVSRAYKIMTRMSSPMAMREQDHCYDYIYANDIGNMKGCIEQAESSKDELSFHQLYGWMYDNC